MKGKVLLRLVYYIVMCVASFLVMLFGFLMLVESEIVSENIARIPSGIAFCMVGFASALRYMILGFDNENYYNMNMKL